MKEEAVKYHREKNAGIITLNRPERLNAINPDLLNGLITQLNVAGEDARVIVQSVHMMYEGDFGAPWAGAPRSSRLVVIGRNLDANEIRDGLAACRAPVPA